MSRFFVGIGHVTPLPGKFENSILRRKAGMHHKLHCLHTQSSTARHTYQGMLRTLLKDLSSRWQPRANLANRPFTKDNSFRPAMLSLFCTKFALAFLH